MAAIPQKRIAEFLKQLGGGQTKIPSNMSSLIEQARKLGFDDVANWISENQATFEIWLSTLAAPPAEVE